MKELLKKRMYFFFIVLLLGCSAGNHLVKQKTNPSDSKKIYYGIEINNVLCGYSEAEITSIQRDGQKITKQKENIFLMLSLFGSKFNTEMTMNSIIHPETKKCSNWDIEILQGSLKRNVKIIVKDSVAVVSSQMNSKSKEIKLTPGILFGHDEVFANLKKDFIDGQANEKVYNILEGMEGEVQPSKFKKVSTEKINLSGKEYDAVVFDQLNQKTGIKIKYWIDTKTFDLLVLKANNRKIFIADRSVVDKIKVANMDENIATKTNVSIADVQAISFMKVKAVIEPVGLWVTQESLNVPGQRFTGSIKDNLIEGVFEIEQKRYDGIGAPSFPADYSKDESLKKYLEAEDLLESDDPVLIKKAREITEGSKNSWEAAYRLSDWVAEEISYAIPGGITARNTYDTKAGECGAHSLLLAAFCRAVGIPARVVWGCMYIPNYGGAFGQHGWTEIYMGQKVGWVPVDATAFEKDYLDSGHIRIGVFQAKSISFNAKKMQILDYKAGTMVMGKNENVIPEKYLAFIGNYTNSQNGNILKVFVQNEALAVDIPNKVVLSFNDPNEKGFWYCKFTNKLYLTFSNNDSGIVEQMLLHEIIPLPKKSNPEQIAENVPEKFKPYLGKYILAALQAEFTVFFQDGSLAVDDPLAKRVVKFQHPDEDGNWLDEFNKNTISFDRDANNNVTSMKIGATTKLNRGAPVANIVE